MTVRAQHSKIFDAIVVPNSVDVVDLNAEPFAPPLGDAAFAATIF
jgi:hypothetical protein